MDTENLTPGISIVIPTYQEIKNLPELIKRIYKIRCHLEIPLELIIVDDNSCDGTLEYMSKLERENDWITFINRTNKKDLSTAVIDGFKKANYQILLCMDADLSHPPEVIPTMIEEILKPNVDLVIGSRFVSGGSIFKNFSYIRSLDTKIAKLIASLFTDVSDPMSGFFCIKNSTFQKADQLDPIGYKICLELIVKCHCKNIVEIPIHFSKRFKGKSKLSLKEMMKYILHILRLAKYKLTQ